MQRGPVSVTGTTYQSTTGIAGREIQRSSAASLADLLSGLPGVSSSAFAPGASRPDIRRLDEYRVRVRVQENGIGAQGRSAEWYARAGLPHAVTRNDVGLNEHRPTAPICSRQR